jgi:hypothetical protein
MNDPNFGRPVGLRIFNLIKNRVTSLNTDLDGKYADIVSNTRSGWTLGDELWVQGVKSTMDIVDLNRVTGEKYTLRPRVQHLKEVLERSLSNVQSFIFAESGSDMQYRLKYDKRDTQGEENEKKRQALILLKDGLIKDIGECLQLVSVFEAYCVSMEPYVQSWNKKNIESCELSLHLQNEGISKTDAKQICSGLGAVLIAHLSYIQEEDMVGSLVPSSARTKLIMFIAKYRKLHPNILHQLDTRPKVSTPRVSTTVTTNDNTNILNIMREKLQLILDTV